MIRRLIFIAAYTLLCVAAIFFFVRGVGAIASLAFGSRGVIAAALSQLAKARVSVPVWILCGPAAVCALMPVKRFNKNAATAISVAILIIAFAAAFLLTKVNGVFVHVAIDIIKMLLGSGAF